MKNLESLFDQLQITTNVFHNGQYCGNWQIDTSGTGFINFHAVTHGQCYLHRNDDGPIGTQSTLLLKFINPACKSILLFSATHSNIDLRSIKH